MADQMEVVEMEIYAGWQQPVLRVKNGDLVRLFLLQEIDAAGTHVGAKAAIPQDHTLSEAPIA